VRRKQSAAGIDILTDGEQSKPGFFMYVRERLEGFEPRPQMKRPFFPAEANAFRVLRGIFQAGDGRRVDRSGRAAGLHGTGQVPGEEALTRDIDISRPL